MEFTIKEASQRSKTNERIDLSGRKKPPRISWTLEIKMARHTTGSPSIIFGHCTRQVNANWKVLKKTPTTKWKTNTNYNWSKHYDNNESVEWLLSLWFVRILSSYISEMIMDTMCITDSWLKVSYHFIIYIYITSIITVWIRTIIARIKDQTIYRTKGKSIKTISKWQF